MIPVLQRTRTFCTSAPSVLQLFLSAYNGRFDGSDRPVRVVFPSKSLELRANASVWELFSDLEDCEQATQASAMSVRTCRGMRTTGYSRFSACKTFDKNICLLSELSDVAEVSAALLLFALHASKSDVIRIAIEINQNARVVSLICICTHHGMIHDGMIQSYTCQLHVGLRGC